MTTMPLVYKNFDTKRDETRLLYLRGLSPSGQVRCSIKQCLLDKRPKYVALSYAWGNPDITKTICVERFEEDRSKRIVTVKTDVEVTVNLESALRQLIADGHTQVWVDALCINQESNDEKNLQILKMKRIYQHASLVIAWLGPEEQDSRTAMSYIQSHHEKESESSMPEKENGETNRPQDQKLLDALEALFRRSYWQRVWIIQEILVAQEVVVLCGPDRVDLKQFERVLRKHPVSQRLLKSGRVPDFDNFRNLENDNAPLPLTKLLWLSRESLASDRRDKIYSLREVSSDGEMIVPTPNYNHTPEKIFTDLTAKHLQKYGRFEPLALRSLHRTPNDNLPSWVPDWGHLDIDRPWLFDLAFSDSKMWIGLGDFGQLASSKLFGEAGKENWKSLQKQFDKTKDKKSIVRIMKRSISAKGTIVGKIDGISSTFEKWAGPEDTFGDLKQPSQTHAHGAYDGDFWVAYAIISCLTMASADLGHRSKDVMTGDITPSQSSPTQSTPLSSLYSIQGRALMTKFYPRVYEWVRKNEKLVIAGRSLSEWMTTPVQANSNKLAQTSIVGKAWNKAYKFCASTPPSASDYHRIFERMNVVISLGMRLFVADHGLIGMAHPQAQAGDVICRFQYCPILFILRPYGKAYRIIGESWHLPAFFQFGQSSSLPSAAWQWWTESEEHLEDIIIE